MIGYIGSLLLSFCGLPELFRTIQDKKCHIGYGMLAMWYLGEILMLIYVLPTNDKPLIINYIANTLIISIMVFFKLKGAMSDLRRV